MYLDYVPMLTKGSLALFFGGNKIASNPNVHSNKQGSPINPTFFIISMMLQGMFYSYKYYKNRKITGNQYSTSNLQCLVLSGWWTLKVKFCWKIKYLLGLGNLYSMFAMISFSSMVAIGVLFARYFVNERTRIVFKMSSFQGIIFVWFQNSKWIIYSWQRI